MVNFDSIDDYKSLNGYFTTDGIYLVVLGRMNSDYNGNKNIIPKLSLARISNGGH